MVGEYKQIIIMRQLINRLIADTESKRKIYIIDIEFG